MAINILEMKNINKSFSNVKVLDNVNFSLEKGEVHALVGSNGAGKSTLMKILAGVYTCDSGTITINDKDVHFHSYQDATQNGIRMIYQELSLIPTFSVAENIFLNNEAKKGMFLSKAEMLAKSEELLKNFGLNIMPKTIVSQMGVGYCQLVEIAKALSQESKILIMDEPTASLSEAETDVLFDIISRLKEKQVSIIYISHRMKEILMIADRVTILRNGKNTITEKTSNLTIGKIIDNMMGEGKIKAVEEIHSIEDSNKPVLLEVNHLRVNENIQDICFNVKRGEVLGFAGLMGSGRTEIVQTLFGLRKKLAGEIKIEGKPIEIHSPGQAIKNNIAYIPEDRRTQGLIMLHSVKDNAILVVLNKIKKGIFISKKKIAKLVNEGISEFNIKTDSMNKRVINLSGGNQQKVVLAKWLKRDPEIIIFDEPTCGIDVLAKKEIFRIVRNLARKGKAIIFISSEMAEIMEVCDRVLAIHKGRITGEILRKDIDSEEVLQHAIQL